jgi:hypothetical protein
MCDVAHLGIDCRDAGAMVDRALADVSASVDSKAHEDGCAVRPLAEQVAWKIAPGEHRSDEVWRVGDSIVAATSRPVPA